MNYFCGVWLLLVFISASYYTDAYLPVIILHGIFASNDDMTDLVSMVKTAHPGTQVYNIDGFDNLYSMEKMWDQVAKFKKKMLPIMMNSTDGVNMICFSQGGLACRGILETSPNHNVKTFISLSSPQGGQFGDTDYLRLFPNYTKELVYKFFYTREGQEVSIANYWRDPHHVQDYMKHNVFLPKLNQPSMDYRNNFLQIEELVLIGGPDDGVITPWQSSHFAFYNENEEVVELEEQEYYLNDSFGLKTLNSNGKLHVHAISGVKHVDWHGNRTVFNCCIEPYLK